MSDNGDFMGKKVIFVHPPDLVNGPIMDILTSQELEVYVLKDHSRIPEINSKYPDSIFFLNVDAAISESEWHQYIQSLNSSCPGIQLGILSFKITDQEQMQFYLLDLGISCGFIQLKQGAKAACEMMMKVLTANEVKGRRKYLRYKCLSEDKATINFSLFENDINGEVLDISSVGLSCLLSAHQGLVKNQLIRNMQLRLRGIIVNADVILMGTRVVEGEQTIYVFLFHADAQSKMKEKVRSYIFTAFQKSFAREFSLR
ncbi:MAG: hypothetical protein PQJ50_03370 [Spirochaetales bacterium]|nr:hypothetical protein [Spirochaetales bacterium]